MVTEAPPKLFRADDLLALAKQNRFSATNRLIVDWVGLGLLDQPKRRGLGRGKGSIAVWDETQAALFIDLLTLRQRPANPIKRVGGLANLPVLGWLYGTPGVPLRQVQRALATWSGRHRQKRNTPLDDATRTASQFVKTVAHPDARVADRAHLRQLVIQSLRDRNSFDRDALHDAVRRVLDPHDEGARPGPGGIRIDADLFVGLTDARFIAIRDLETFTSDDYETARRIYIQSRAGYAKDQPHLAADPQYGHLFSETPTLEHLLNSACVDLITILGMSRTPPRPPTE